MRARLPVSFTVLVLIAGWAAAASEAQKSFDIYEASIPEIQAALAEGRTTAQFLVARYLERIEAYDKKGPSLNAISVINPNAMTEAAQSDADRAAGRIKGPLAGIPVIIKDNYGTVGLQTADGTISLKGWAPNEDAALVARLKAAGAIVLAKSNMQEFARGIINVGSLFGSTRNPYNTARNPGGSSGGTGAAIAANFAAFGMGSDTCGSIRIPSSHNSLVGLRGTQGLTSRTGIIPLSHNMDIGGPLGRSVTDVAVVLDVVAGYDPTDPQTAANVGQIPKSYTDFLQLTGLRGARIGILKELLSKVPEDEEVAAVIRAASQEMKAAGAEIVEVSMPSLPGFLTYRDGGSSPLIPQDFVEDFNAYLAAHPSAPVRSIGEIYESKRYDPHLEAALKEMTSIGPRDSKLYFETLAKRGELQEVTLKAMADAHVDALIYPTIRRKAAPVGDNQDGSNCALASIAGLPAISVPAGFTPDGMPVGLEILGRAWSEPQLIKFAYAYEQRTRHRHPPPTTPALP